MKVLVVSPSCAYVDRMSLNHRDIMDFIRRDDNFRVIEVEEVRDVNVDAYDVIINDTWPEFNKDFFASRTRARVGKFFEDYRQLQERNQCITGKEYDFLILRYKTPITLGTSIFDIPAKYFLPHHFDLDVYKNYGLEKTFDVFIYGSMYEPLYPFRVRMRNLLLSNRDRYKIKYIEHCGYTNTETCIRRVELSTLINQSWMSLSVPMDFTQQRDDFLKKFGESSLSYSLILGYIPEEAERYYGTNYCRCTPDMTDEEILLAIDQELSDKKKILEKIESVYNVFRENFNIHDYSDKLYRICESIVASAPTFV